MLFRSAPLVLSALLGAATAAAAPFAPAVLGQNGLALKNGDGRVNGYDLPVTSIEGFAGADALFAKLVAACAGRCTVTREATDVSQVFVIADVASDMCQTCLPMTRANAGKIMETAHTVSVFDLGGAPTFAIATPTGKLLKHLVDAPLLAYEGKILAKTLPKLTIKGQSRFAFAGSRTESLSGVVAAAPEEALALLESDLRAAGFRPFSEAGRAGELPRGAFAAEADKNRNVWVKSQTALRYQLTPLTGSSTMVELNEVTGQ